MRILIIEDDIAFAKVVVRRLEKYEHKVVHCEEANAGLLMCRDFWPEVILLDMKLANDSGLRHIPALRSLLPNSRIILLTGFASIATAVEAIKLGADEYLAKPIDTQTLLTTISGQKVNASELEQQDTLSSEQLEWEHIHQALKLNSGNISATARQLSMHRRTLQRKLSKRPSFTNKD